MKISIFLIYCVATIILPYCHGGIGDLVGKAKDVGILTANVGKGLVQKVPDLIPTPENV